MDYVKLIEAIQQTNTSPVQVSIAFGDTKVLFSVDGLKSELKSELKSCDNPPVSPTCISSVDESSNTPKPEQKCKPANPNGILTDCWKDGNDVGIQGGYYLICEKKKGDCRHPLYKGPFAEKKSKCLSPLQINGKTLEWYKIDGCNDINCNHALIPLDNAVPKYENMTNCWTHGYHNDAADGYYLKCNDNSCDHQLFKGTKPDTKISCFKKVNEKCSWWFELVCDIKDCNHIIVSQKIPLVTACWKDSASTGLSGGYYLQCSNIWCNHQLFEGETPATHTTCFKKVAVDGKYGKFFILTCSRNGCNHVLKPTKT